MKNTVIIGFGWVHTKKGILQLAKNGLVNIQFWGACNGERLEEDNICNLPACDLKVETLCEEVYYNEVYRYLAEFITVTSRWNMTIENYNHIESFNSHINFWYNLFKQKKIELLICDDMPNSPHNCIAYRLAKAMQIDTACFMNIFPAGGKILCCKNLECLGIEKVRWKMEYPYVNIIKTHKKSLFYMKNAKHEAPRIGKKDIGGLFNAFYKLFLKGSIWKALKKTYDFGFTRCFEQLGYDMIVRHLDYKFKKYIQEHKFDIFNEDCDYVYFPLHYQPEMVTDILGDIYRDQLLAVERLAQIIPDNWVIYVKDNPKQSYYKRNGIFFERLLNIKKVRWVNYSENTYEMIENSKFVATITGTAGWEAITGGKNVLVFGYAWYRGLPGVFQYSSQFRIEEILNYVIIHEELEVSYNNFLKTLFSGVVATTNMKNVDPEYEVNENNTKIYNALKTVILSY